MDEDIYVKNGYDHRIGYLNGLAEEYSLDLDQVVMIAELLGPDEDFDGLISELQDLCNLGC